MPAMPTTSSWTSDAILGIHCARELGADVINARWGRQGEDGSVLLRTAIEAFIADGGHLYQEIFCSDLHRPDF